MNSTPSETAKAWAAVAAVLMKNRGLTEREAVVATVGLMRGERRS